MRRDDVLRIPAAHRHEIAAFGVIALSIFGSVARDEAGPESDVDRLVEFGVPVRLFAFVARKNFLETVLGPRVDLATPDARRESMKAEVLREAVRAA